jgi:hypothetical protein
MDQGTGTAVQDQSMYGNNGTLSGGYWGPGYSGSGLCFSSDGQGVIIPDAPSINVTTGISICAWINGNYSSQTCAIAYKTYDYFLALSNRRLYGGLVTSQGISKVWGVTPMPSSTWTFVAMTYDRTSGGYPTDLLDCDGFNPYGLVRCSRPMA